MRLQQNKLQRAKAAIHGVQALLIFVAACLTLAVITKSGGHGGETSFYFALCFVTIPALIYQIMVPMWSRAWRLNNVWAYAVIDLVLALLWFAASVAVAVWNGRGIAKGKSTAAEEDTSTTTKRAEEPLLKDGTCNSFGYGSPSKCSVSKATVGLGIIVFFLFCVTAAIAIHAIKQYRQHGTLPNPHLRNTEQKGPLDQGDGGKDVWDPSTEDLHNTHDHLAAGYNTSNEGLLGAGRRSSNSDQRSHMDAEGMAHPGHRASSWDGSGQTANAPDLDNYYAPSALSPPGYATSPGGAVQFPEANYSALR